MAVRHRVRVAGILARERLLVVTGELPPAYLLSMTPSISTADLAGATLLDEGTALLLAGEVSMWAVEVVELEEMRRRLAEDEP